MNTDRFQPKKSLGQNFLIDGHYLHKIAETALIAPGNQVLEIGPGLGHLTKELIPRAGKLIIIEVDNRLIPILRQEFGQNANVELVHADALTYDYGALSGSWKIVANLPYYISTPLIQTFIDHRAKFTSLTLLLQKEVAERIAAPPGGKEYGYLSVMVQLYTVPRLEFTVPAGAFEPRPAVDSAVITLTVRQQPAAIVKDEQYLITVVKAAFSQRRKTLRNSLSQLGFSKSILEEAGSATGINLTRRAETLEIAEFGRLADYLIDRQGPGEQLKQE